VDLVDAAAWVKLDLTPAAGTGRLGAAQRRHNGGQQPVCGAGSNFGCSLFGATVSCPLNATAGVGPAFYQAAGRLEGNRLLAGLDRFPDTRFRGPVRSAVSAGSVGRVSVSLTGGTTGADQLSRGSRGSHRQVLLIVARLRLC
jgi:hypothetical protein